MAFSLKKPSNVLKHLGSNNVKRESEGSQCKPRTSILSLIDSDEENGKIAKTTSTKIEYPTNTHKNKIDDICSDDEDSIIFSPEKTVTCQNNTSKVSEGINYDFPTSPSIFTESQLKTPEKLKKTLPLLTPKHKNLSSEKLLKTCEDFEINTENQSTELGSWLSNLNNDSILGETILDVSDNKILTPRPRSPIISQLLPCLILVFISSIC